MNVSKKKSGNGKDTKRDYMIQFIWKRVQDEMAWHALCQFVDGHDFDTDCIEDDVELFDEENESNLQEEEERIS